MELTEREIRLLIIGLEAEKSNLAKQDIITREDLEIALRDCEEISSLRNKLRNAKSVEII